MAGLASHRASSRRGGEQPRAGWIHVICGCMFSGKTEELVRLARRAEIAGRRVALASPSLDTRTGSARVVSRSGHTFPSHAITRSSELLGIDADLVGIEEAQFLDDELAQVVEALARRGVDVIVAGLDTDFLGRPFGPMPDLLTIADEVTKLTAICVVCGGEATRSQRLLDGRPARRSDSVVVLGGFDDERYEARCRACHVVEG